MNCLGSIDWAATGQWMQAWAGLAGAFAVYIVAQQGFKVWVRQRQAERKIAAAEQILNFVYRAKEVFPSIRNPMQSLGEIAEARAKLSENFDGYDGLPEGTKKRAETGQVYLSRVFSNGDLWKAMWDCLPLARAFFGPEFEATIRSAWHQRARIYTAAQMYGDLDPDLQCELSDKFECVLWEGWAAAQDKPDEISDALAHLVAESERILLPVISDSGWPQR